MPTSTRLTAFPRRAAPTQGAVRPLYGPRLVDLQAAILGFNTHGLSPSLAYDGERPDDGPPADLLVAADPDGYVRDVFITGYGLDRLRANPARLDLPARELTPAEARDAFAQAFVHLPALARSR